MKLKFFYMNTVLFILHYIIVATGRSSAEHFALPLKAKFNVYCVMTYDWLEELAYFYAFQETGFDGIPRR